MNLVRVERGEDGLALLVIANPPVNALSAPVRADLVGAVVAAERDHEIRAIVIAAEGKAFVAGADIGEFGKPPVPPVLPDVLQLIEQTKKPVVAAIQGVAFGGGFELALACHGRVIGPAARVGLPEIKLGLIPGAGGTQRLPRLLGAAPAFALMLSGESVNAAKALALGLADRLAEGDLLAEASAYALELAGAGHPPQIRTRTDKFSPDDRAAFETAAADAIKRAAKQPNVAALADAVRAAMELPFDEGLAHERARFVPLVNDPTSKALRHIFFAERAAGRIPGVGDEVKERPIAQAAVIGAGTMGGGIAMSFAQAGIPVTLIEVDEAALEGGLRRIRANYEASAKRGSISAEATAKQLGLIQGVVGVDAAADADVIVEAAFEDMGVKADVFGELDRIAKPGAILATNTSYLDVDAIAAFTSRPADVVGLHFFSPANIMRLLEVVRGAKTAPDVLVTSLALGRKLGKLPVTVGVCYGFVGNRMLAKRGQAAERLLLAGAMPHELDAAVTDFGFRMGQFAMADLAGLDIGWRARKANGSRAPVADALCEMGRFGQKTGRGFYLYPDGARKGERDPETEALIVRLSDEQGIERRSFSHDEMIARLFYPMVNEGAKILSEGVAARASDVDAIWVNGYNWPAFTGGPMHWADQIGLGKIVAGLDQIAEETGDQALRPAELLRRVAAGGGALAEMEAL